MNLLSPIFKRIGVLNDEHTAMLKALEYALNSAKEDSDLTKLELVITTSTGIWLNIWGSWFGITRLDAETDDDYRNRILAVVTNSKNTIPAIISTIRSFFQDPNIKVVVFEPHTEVRKFNESAFSGNDKFQSRDYYRSAVIDIYLPTLVNDSLKDAIDKVRAGGVKVYYTRIDEITMEKTEEATLSSITAETNMYAQKDVELTIENEVTRELNLSSSFSPYLLAGSTKVTIADIESYSIERLVSNPIEFQVSSVNQFSLTYDNLDGEYILDGAIDLDGLKYSATEWYPEGY